MGMVAYFIEVPNEVLVEAIDASSIQRLSLKPRPFWKFWVKSAPNSATSMAFDPIILDAFENEKYSYDDIDKAWDMLHRCLNNGIQEPLRSTVAAKAITGDQEFASAVAMGVQTLTADSVKQVNEALKTYREAELKTVLPKLSEDTYCLSGDNSEDLDYVLQAFTTAKKFYSVAATNNSAVIIAIA